MANYIGSTLSQESDLINSDLEEIIFNELKNNSYPPQIINLTPEYVDFEGMYTAPPQDQIAKQMEQREIPSTPSTNDSLSPTGTFPCMDTYKGPLDFELFLDGSTSSHRSWVYSHILHKVFLDINKVLLIQFKTSPAITGLRIRALAIYSMADKRNYAVNRCTVHSIEVDPQCLAHKDEGTCLCANYKWAGHVIQTSHSGACYEYDSQSGRHSVTVPLDAVQPGCDTVTVPYCFTCKTSCTSGMSRKPIEVIFTLETPAGEVIGRQTVAVKICSCPKRDKSREETDNKVTREDAERLGLDPPVSLGKRKVNRSVNNNLDPLKKIKVENTNSPCIATDATVNTTQVLSAQHEQYIKRINEIENVMSSGMKMLQECLSKMTECSVKLTELKKDCFK